MTVFNVCLYVSSSFYLTKMADAMKMSTVTSDDIFWPFLKDL